jgi:hypothetical protein
LWGMESICPQFPPLDSTASLEEKRMAVKTYMGFPRPSSPISPR